MHLVLTLKDKLTDGRSTTLVFERVNRTSISSSDFIRIPVTSIIGEVYEYDRKYLLEVVDITDTWSRVSQSLIS